jgi:hypothetical protein
VDFGSLLPPRSVEDVLAERVRLVIGGEVYDLPVLSIADNRAWKERMDMELGYLLLRVTVEDDGEAILRLFDSADDLFLDLLVSYDRTGVLPGRDRLEAELTQMALVRAVLEVWRAARPLADIAAIGMATLPTPTPSWRERTSAWLRRTAGRPARSSES